MTRHATLKMLSLTLGRACAVASLAAAIAPAVSARGEAAGIARVPYGDLNLASPAGESQLNARVWAAARMLCRPNALLTDIVTQACIRNAFHAARPQILSAIDTARNAGLAASRTR